MSCLDDFNKSEIEIYKEVIVGKYRKSFPNGFWKKPYGQKSSKICIKYLFDEILQCKTKEDYISRCNIQTFKDNKLKGMVTVLFENSTIDAFIYAYGKKFIKPWEFKQAPKKFWKNKENVKKLIPWLFKKEKINDKNVYEKYNYNLFLKHGVTSALDEFDYSPFKALNYVYPNKYISFLFTQSHGDIWANKDNVRKVVEYLLKKEQIDDSNIYEKYNNHLFISNGQKVLLKQYKNNSFLILEDMYPGKYEISKFKWFTEYKYEQFEEEN